METPRAEIATPQTDGQKESDQSKEMLEILGYNSIPKKRPYTKEDFAAIIGKDIKTATYIINKAKLIDTGIEGEYGTGDDYRRLFYTEEEIRKIVSAEEARPKRKTRAIASEKKDQAAPETQAGKKTIFDSGAPDVGNAVVLEKQEALVEPPIPTLETSNEGYLILDGIPLEDLDEVEKGLLNFIIARSNQVQTTSYDDFKRYIESSGKTIKVRQVRFRIGILNDKLLQADCAIVNTAPRTGTTKAAFILKKGSLEGEKQVAPEEQTTFPEDQAKQLLRTEDIKRIKQQIATDLTLTISSHFASNNLGNVTTRPDSLLAPLLPPKTTLEEVVGSRFRKETDRFFVDSLVGKLEGLQDTKDPKSLSVKERQILENLRVADKDLKTVIQTVCRHFLVPIPNKYT